jgi:bacterial/archaeal transporter family-2 protein
VPPSLGAALFLFLAGIAAGGLSALQAAVNGRLSGHTGTFNAVLISISVSFVAILALGLATRSPRDLSLAGVPPYLLLGGVAGLAYVAAMTYLAPRLGVTPTLVAAIAGQLIAAIVLDHFGVLRDGPIHVNLPRLLAAALVLIAVPLSRVS